MDQKESVLIIEDETDIREGIRILLESENYNTIEAANGRAGLEALDDRIDLIILDVMMPGMSGLQTCREIRKISNVPVLFLTARAQESDKLIGFMAGGDDYITKPFSYAELLGRIKALIRRYKTYNRKKQNQTELENEYIELKGIRLHREYNEVFVREACCNLSNIEYKMLKLMMESPLRIFTAQNLYERIWDEPYFYSCNATVMVHIRKLRVKIEEDPNNPKLIKTIWGKGYQFDAYRS